MAWKTALATLGLLASPSLATWSAYQEYLDSIPGKADLERPTIEYDGHQPYQPLPESPKRHRQCKVKTHNDLKTDDSQHILDALHKCNDGGKVVFPAGKTYVIGTALDLSFLKHIDIAIQGYVQFTNDTNYWQANSFPQVFQNATTFFTLGGQDVNIYGGGMLDGNGQIWYDLYAENIYVLRPILFGVAKLHGGSVANLRWRYSPQYYSFIQNTTDLVFDNIDISGFSQSENTAKNTDGWDTYRSSNIVIQESVVNNGDDCVSFKPNSTEILVQNMHCNGSHGISVGSLGQYPGTYDIVEDVMVSNIEMSNATDGARIKVWPGSPSALSGDLQGGGGSGRVSRITYEGYRIENVDYAIEVTQCYGQKNLTLCNAFPSSLTITNISISDFQGTTSSKYSPISGYLVCSDPDVCSGIELDNIHVTAPDGTENLFTCGSVDESLLHGINCTTQNKGGN